MRRAGPKERAAAEVCGECTPGFNYVCVPLFMFVFRGRRPDFLLLGWPCTLFCLFIRIFSPQIIIFSVSALLHFILIVLHNHQCNSSVILWSSVLFISPGSDLYSCFLFLLWHISRGCFRYPAGNRIPVVPGSISRVVWVPATRLRPIGISSCESRLYSSSGLARRSVESEESRLDCFLRCSCVCVFFPRGFRFICCF